jgi:hypothetical protein
MAGESGDLKQVVLSRLKDFVASHFVTESGAPLLLTTYQERFIRDVLEDKNPKGKYVFLACTRVGKTEAAACLGTLVAILNDGEEVTIVAPTHNQAERMFKRVRNYFMSNKALFSLLDLTRGFRRDEINLVNASTLRCLSAGNPESLLGFGATTLIVDEAGSISVDVMKTRVLRMLTAAPARGARPRLILLGTPHVGNFLYEAWTSDEFFKYKVGWKDGVEAGILSRDEVEYARKVMSDEQFRCWYEAEFLNLSGSGLFNLREVALCMSGELLKKAEPGYDYYAGLDIARFGDDETALVICRIPVGATVEEQPVELVWYKTRSKKSISDTVGWVLDICQKWGVKYIAVDEVGLGAGAVDFLRERLGDIVYPVSLVGNERRDVYMTLQSMIENRQLVLPRNDELLLRQFSSFKAEYTSDGRIMIKKTKGMRDDVVDALALCCYLMKRKRSAEGHVEYVGDVIQL